MILYVVFLTVAVLMALLIGWLACANVLARSELKRTEAQLARTREQLSLVGADPKTGRPLPNGARAGFSLLELQILLALIAAAFLAHHHHLLP